jgi:hypothetical protein
MAITPFSQLFNTLVFAVFALTTFRVSTLFAQGAVLAVSLLFFKSKLRDFGFGSIIRIIPILLFVFTLNCFRGNGEIVLRLGILVVVKQGIQRGIYYSCVIAELFAMSRLLTRGFGENELVAAFASVMPVAAKRRGRRHAESETARGAHTVSFGDFLLVLFHVLKIFRVAYAEMKFFFSPGTWRKGDGRGLRGRIISYFHEVYTKSLEEFENADAQTLGQRRGIKLLPLDYLLIAFQTAFLAASLFVRV